MEREPLESFQLVHLGPIRREPHLKIRWGSFFALLRHKYVKLGVEVELFANDARGFAAIAQGDRDVAVGEALTLAPDDYGASGEFVQLVLRDFDFFEVRVFAEIVEGHVGAGATVGVDTHRLHRVVDAFEAKTARVDFVGSCLCGFGESLSEVRRREWSAYWSSS